MRRRRCRPAVEAAVLLFAVAGSLSIAAAEDAPDVPRPAGGASDAGARDLQLRDLQLEVLINDRPLHLIGAFRQLPDGSLAATAAELRDIGLAADRTAADAEGLVRLQQLRGVSYRIDEAAQAIHITAPDEARAPHIVDLRPRIEDPPIAPQRSVGGVLNYTLFASSDGAFWRDLKSFQGVSGAFDARVFGPYGTLSQSLIASTSSRLDNLIRLESTWAYSDLDRLVTYRAGDTISGGLTWTRPVRLGGVQAQRSFALRPDLVTLPIPSLSGSAAVPSTIDVYTQNVKTYSGAVPQGPFQVTNLPVVTGAGSASVVIQDSLGRQAVTTLPFYASTRLLREGLYDFSGEIGFARRHYGVESDNYDPRPVGSASGRYGLADWLTLEGHAEGGAGLVNGGLGAAFVLGPLGVASLALAGSHTGERTGGLVNASLEMTYGAMSFYARTQRTLGGYEDIASITAPLLDLARKDFSFFRARVPKALDQISIGVPLSFDRSSLNLSFTQIESAVGDRNRIVGLSYSRGLFRNSTAFATAFKDLDDRKSFGVFAGISVPLGNDITASGALQHGPNGPSGVLDVTKSERLEDGSYGWRVRDAEGRTPDRLAAASYRSSFGRTEASVQQFGGRVRGTAQVDGSVAVAGGGVFLGNRIDDAFAVVNAGAPNVAVQYENRPVGVTNSAGLLLVPYLNSYQKNKISIDPKNLPVDADIPKTREVVVPADRSGVVVSFGVSEAANAALVIFVGAGGEPIKVGARVRLDGAEQTFVVGYDGLVYVRNLRARNVATVELPGGGSCQAEFDYTPRPGEQVRLTDVVCR